MLHVMTPQPLYLIIFFTWTMVTCHDDSSLRNIENSLTAALHHYHLYMNNGHVPWWLIAEEYRKLYLSRFTALFSMAQQWSRDMITHRGWINFWKRILLAHLFCVPRLQFKIIFRNLTFILLWHALTRSDHTNTSHNEHAPSEWHHLTLTQTLFAHL